MIFMDEEEIKTPPDLVMLFFYAAEEVCHPITMCFGWNFNLPKNLGIFKWEFYNGMQQCDTSYALTANQKLLNCKYLMEIIWSHIWKYQAVFLSYTPANGSAEAKKHARHSMLPANVVLS